MTKNQIDYWQAVSNRAIAESQLAESKRHALEQERLTSQANMETVRSNYAREQETHRSNVAKETETARHNLATLTEQQRANQAREAEAYRANLRNEELQAEKNRLQQMATLESARHNAAVESENARSNKAQEAISTMRNVEAERSNRANEAISTRNAITNQYQQQQQGTSLVKQDSYKKASILETERHNREMEDIQRAQTSANSVNNIISTIGNVIGRGFTLLKQGR